MSQQPTPTELTPEQKSQICGILSVGCDRQTAADYVGSSLADIRHAMQQDASFLADVCRAEAAIELTHMRNVEEVATGKKDWRASVWWLEQRSPERFARKVGTLTARQLKAFTALLIDIYRDEVHDAADRERLTARFKRVVEMLEQMLVDAQPGRPEMNNAEMKLLTSDLVSHENELDEDARSTDFSP